MFDSAKKAAHAPKYGNDGRGLVGRAGDAPRAGIADEVQLGGEKLPGSVRKKTLTLVHFGNVGNSGVVDPGFVGEGKATARGQTGLPATFSFEKGSPLNTDRDLIARGKQTYGAKVNGGRIYDWGNAPAV